MLHAFGKYANNRVYWIQGNSNNFAKSLLNASGTNDAILNGVEYNGFAPGFHGFSFSEVFGRQEFKNLSSESKVENQKTSAEGLEN